MANVEPEPIINGRANRAWAANGTNCNAFTFGHMIGPPAENAYAVEPVGVDTITPSQPKELISTSSTRIDSSTILPRSARSNVMSFNAQSSIGSLAPGSHTSTCAIMRSSME
ncbi:unknown [Bifidobacterium pseudocatenulatum CAG:263]|nr:unknown [Bifidobacterium pseudocatenulatum CAG:263]